MNQRRRLLFFSVVVVVAGLLVVEGGARVLYSFYYGSPIPLLYGFRHSDLGAVVSSLSQQRLGGWRQNEKIRKILRRPDFSTLNSYGFIGPEFSIRKPKDRYRIVALGSSTTAGNLGIAGTQRYPYTGFLQELFDGKGGFKIFGKKVEVLNAAETALSIGGIYQRLWEKVLPLDPDLIIISSAWVELMPITNLVRAQFDAQKAAPHPWERAEGRNKRQMLVRWYASRVSFSITPRLARVSLLVIGMQAVARRLLAGKSSLFLGKKERKRIARVIATHPLFEAYEDSLTKIVRLLRGRGICLLLLRGPYKHAARHFRPPNRLYYKYPLSRIYEIVERVAKRHRVPVADAEAFFNRMPDKELLFGDIMHMNQEGYEKLASLVYRVILDRKIIEKRGC